MRSLPRLPTVLSILALASFVVVPSALAAPRLEPSAEPSRPFAAATQRKLEAALDEAWGKTVAPGVIVGVWVGDRGWTATRGTARKGARIRPRQGDHTRIGSLTKTFTGTLILQLVDQGKLKLTDTIDRWFPWVPGAGQITVRDLGDMGSGINTYTGDQSFLDAYFAHPRKAWSPIGLIKDAVSLPPKFAPGEGFFYSNTNFLLLGQIAQKVGGKPVGRLLRERIFEPLGMTHTSYPHTTAMPAPFWNGYTTQDATGDSETVRDATHWSPTAYGAAGQIVSTLGDMRIWAKAIGTGSLLTSSAHRAQLTPNPHAISHGRQYDFGVGDDHGWITHAGTVPGYNSDFGYLKKLDATIVVLSNTDTEAQPKSQPSPAIMSALSEVIAPGDPSSP